MDHSGWPAKDCYFKIFWSCLQCLPGMDMTSTLKYADRKLLESQHYRVLRGVFKDRCFKYRREDLDQMAQRATAREGANYITASTSFKLLHLQNTPLAKRLLE